VAVVTALVFLYALHQDVWLWRTARPLVFGFLPAGLAYHAGYTIAISIFMFMLVRFRWPSHLEPANERAGGTGAAKPPGER
jgi:hypothetical protein